jgi:hypothetical protein
MATSTKANFVLYDDQFYAGQVETLQRNINVFNAASGNTIRLESDMSKGDFMKESFFQNTAHHYHRDPTSISNQTATGLAMDDQRSPKINKGYLIESTLDSFKKLGEDDREMSYVLGKQLGVQIMDQYLSSALAALVGGFQVTAVAADLTLDRSTQGMTSLVLNDGIRKMGDAASRIRMLVMHSKVYFDLIGNQVQEKLLEVTAGNLYGGTPATYGRPVLVIDNDALFTAGSGTSVSTDDVYWTFGLTDSAIIIKESEERSVLAERVGGKHNLIARLQGEYAYNLTQKGMDYVGAVNPANATLAGAAAWAKVYADKRSLMGVAIKTR